MILKDGLTYTYTLRDAQWENGDPVTADDFEYAWKWALDPENASDYAYQLYYIEGAEAYNTGEGSADDVAVTAVDEKTLEVNLVNPTPYFDELTAFYTYYPVNSKNSGKKERLMSATRPAPTCMSSIQKMKS